MRLPQLSFELFATVLFPLLAACGDDDGSGPDRLTAEDVGGVYSVCTLTFAPAGGVLPAVNILQKATQPGTTTTLTLNNTADRQQFEFAYTPTGEVLAVRPRGNYGLGTSTVELNFSGGPAPATLLLPNQLTVDYQANPKQMQTPAQQDQRPRYNVPRADYARLAEVAETNLPSQVEGTLDARFATGACT